MKATIPILDSIRLVADYYLVGPWPEVVKGPLPEIFKAGKRYAVAIIALED